MVSQKRKTDLKIESRPDKKRKAAADEPPGNASRGTILRDEEEAFPRGGSSVLTPLEKRQINIQAKQDVLFEQNTGKKAPRDEGDLSSDDDLAPAEASSGNDAKLRTEKKSKGKNSKKSGKPGASASGGQEPEFKIGSLSYKRLISGSVALGQVSAINKYDVTIALPNNLVGYVPLTAISDKATQTVEDLAAADAAEDDEAEAADDADAKEFQLKDYVSERQYLRVLVTSVGPQQQAGRSKGSKNHVSLSIMPEQVNQNLSLQDLVPNNVVQASVDSVEDHGLIMNLGNEFSTMRAFMGTKDLPFHLSLSDIKPGAVMLCLITGVSSSGKILKLSANHSKLGNLKKEGFLTDAPSVDAFQPGTAVETLITAVGPRGVTGKVMGLLDVTADAIHCAAYESKMPLEKRFAVGSKAKARVICTFPGEEQKRLGISFLPHLLSLVVHKPQASEELPQRALPLATIVNEAKVFDVDPNSGIYLDVGVRGVRGFSHISRLSDEKVSELSEDSGAYKKGTVHKARVVGYNPMDGLYLLSLEQSILDSPFLSVEDLQLGQVVSGTVEKFITNSSNSMSIVLRLTKHIDGLVPHLHISDVQLHDPEKKFKIGTKINARVLNVDKDRRRVRLTLKKSLVNSDAPVWSSYSDIKVGTKSPGTIVNILQSGAVVQYYGLVRGFLPVSQMSETFIKDPREHFRLGQAVTTWSLSVEPPEGRMTVSCLEPNTTVDEKRQAFEALEVGSTISGVVFEKTNDEIILESGAFKVKAILHVDHLADGSAQKCQNAAKRIRVGQSLQDLLILRKSADKQLLFVSNKPSLLKARRAGNFPTAISELDIGAELFGYVKNLTDTAVFVQFAADLVGLLPRTQIGEASLKLPDLGLRKNSSITAKVLSIDDTQARFVLTQKEAALPTTKSKPEAANDSGGKMGSATALDFGTKVQAKINSIKDSQLNVTLDQGIQGRIDVSSVFDRWEDIHDRKKPLAMFKSNDTVEARVIGMHNHRNHKYLPITHAGRAHVYELTMKKSDLAEGNLNLLAIDSLRQGEEYLCFVNNANENGLWVNLSPSVRGRIRAIDVSDNISTLADLETTYPPGSAIRARVTNIDHTQNHVDLSARIGANEAPKVLTDLKEGSVIPGRVTRVNERQIMVQLSDSVSGPVHLVDMSDDFSKADPSKFDKNQVIRVCVTAVDLANKKLTLSTRPSKVLSSSLPVVDKEITSIDQLKVSDTVRGFIKNVAANGLFIALSSQITAFVRVSDLSDSFIKDWQAEHEVDRLVRGKIIAVDPSSNHVQMSLKQSVLNDSNYTPPITYKDLKVGQVVTGSVRKVEEFGVFIVVDNSINVSGLCHKSEIADETVSDIKALFNAGDKVKAKVLRSDAQKRRVAFGLKASYFDDSDDEMQALDSDNESIADSDSVLSDDPHGVAIDSTINHETDDTSDQEMNPSDDEELSLSLSSPSKTKLKGGSVGNLLGSGLTVGSLDWQGLGKAGEASSDESGSEEEELKPKKKRKAQIQVDRTADLDVKGPQSAADFERLLLSEPNSSLLWLSYMAHYLKLNEIEKAREIAERATRTVNHQMGETEEEALNVWIGFLNLENTYGTDESLEEVFKRAVQHNDTEEIHARLASIYIQSKKTENADKLLMSMTKKFSQDPKVWVNYADFLFDTLQDPVRGRSLLPRALQSLPKHDHVDLTAKFGQLEFKSENGDPERGRTIFEGLIDTYPKRIDLYNVLLDLETKAGDKDQIRRLYQRVTSGKLKPKQAKFFFKRWIEFEEKEGDQKAVNKVTARAEEWVRKQAEES